MTRILSIILICKNISAFCAAILPEIDAAESEFCAECKWSPDSLTDEQTSNYIKEAKQIEKNLIEEYLLEILLNKKFDIKSSLEFLEKEKEKSLRKSAREKRELLKKINDLKSKGLVLGARVEGWFQKDEEPGKSKRKGIWHAAVITEIDFSNDIITITYDEDRYTEEVNSEDFLDEKSSGMRLQQLGQQKSCKKKKTKY
jgi:hypothetical protein